MKFTAEINVMPQKALLDPQGKTVSANLKNIGLDALTNVRIGKRFTSLKRLTKLRLKRWSKKLVKSF